MNRSVTRRQLITNLRANRDSIRSKKVKTAADIESLQTFEGWLTDVTRAYRLELKLRKMSAE